MSLNVQTVSTTLPPPAPRSGDAGAVRACARPARRVPRHRRRVQQRYPLLEPGPDVGPAPPDPAGLGALTAGGYQGRAHTHLGVRPAGGSLGQPPTHQSKKSFFFCCMWGVAGVNNTPFENSL